MDYFYPHQSFKTPSPEKQQNTELPFPWQRLGKRWGGDGGTSASQSLQGRRVRDRQVVPVIQETWAPAMQMRLVKRPSIMSGDKKPGVCSGAASSRAAATLNTSLL